MSNSLETELRNLATITGDVALKEIFDLKKKFQEYKAVLEERERLRERMWKERLTFVTILATSWGITIATCLHFA